MHLVGISTLALTFLFLLFSTIHLAARQYKRSSQSRAKGSALPLPPGSLGWPFIGETLRLYSRDPAVFFAAKQKRYGEIFKTHMLGYPCVMLTSPEAARFVLVSKSHLFKPTYPKSKEQMIGPWFLMFHQGDYHAHVRKLVQGSLLPDALRGLVPDIEDLVVAMLDSWDGRVVKTYQAMKRLSFDVGILAIFGHLESRHKEELKKNYAIVDKGYNSLPTNIPWTPYHKAIQARKRLSKILSEIISERREEEEEEGSEKRGLLDGLMSSRDEGDGVVPHLTDEQIADNVNGVLFAAQDTTASVLTWILKFLHDDPKLLESVKAEQMGIYDSNGRGEQHLTWSQTRNMPATHRVILESLRMASVISFTFREAAEDVEYKGYLIPKGWKVMPLFRNIHHNADFFHDPRSFEPSRFKVPPKPNTFLPFGTGVHTCPGNELAKLEMRILVHHLVTKYRWELLLGSRNETEYCPFLVPKQGLPAKITRVLS